LIVIPEPSSSLLAIPVAPQEFDVNTLVKYLAANDPTQFIFASVTNDRDVSVTSWGEDCVWFLRSAGGKAWFFRYNYNAGTPNGHGVLLIGTVTGLTTGAIGSNGTFYTVYQNQDLQESVPGYDPSNTAGKSFTFSVQGIQVCAFYNNVQITCFTDYRDTSVGAVQAQCNTGGGIRDTTVAYLPSPSMYSHPASNLLDVRDFGLKAVSTTGSIAASSTSLSVASSNGFNVGDQIIVATGGESSIGPGTIGVGGALPARTYANLAAANADLPNQADGAWMRTLDTNTVYRKYTTSINYIGQIWYQQHSDPIAPVAKITAISGNTLMLDTAASVSTTNANVYFDNGAAFNAIVGTPAEGQSPLTPPNQTLNFAAGTFAFYSGPGNSDVCSLGRKDRLDDPRAGRS
jgi:hypothetical protein